MHEKEITRGNKP